MSKSRMIEIIDENTTIVEASTPIGEINEQMGLRSARRRVRHDRRPSLRPPRQTALTGRRDDYDSVHLVVEQTDGRRIQKVKIIKSEGMPSALEGEQRQHPPPLAGGG